MSRSFIFKESLFLMDKDNKWMLITYYCPTHGNAGIVKPIEITKNEVSETFLKKGIIKINNSECT